ncbi:MAG TPA: protein kinase [Gemmatimonadales bacterium]|nr:protein kinase [Gemmatimonadales bacterium]
MHDLLTRLQAALADRYRLDRELGAGGMATVYLAHDVRHGRPVALKLLRPELAAVIGAERFLAEIRTTANLQHPHILPLFDSGEADGFLFYVMPFVEGESLRDRLTREKQLPVADAVRVASEVASALDYAHRHGVIHRDIKPENILLHDGQALVADFGIALAASKAGGTRMTETGMSLGTPHYMSPEQAMGEREIGPRSDVYALGAVTYEMLAGDPPFLGSTAQAIVAKVITEKPPPLTAARDTVPPAVAAAVHQALAKLPADRFASAAEFAAALAGRMPAGTDSGALAATTVTAHPRSPARLARPALPWVLLAFAVLAIGALVARGRSSGRPPAEPVRFSIQLPPADRLQAGNPLPAFSPDGRRLAIPVTVAGQDMIALRQLGQAEAEPVRGTEDGALPFFSPDGVWIAFTAQGKLRKVRVEGGAPIVLADSRWGGGSWAPDGTIIYSQSYKSGLWRVSAGGGTAEPLTTPDSAAGELGHWWPQFLPDGRHVVFTNFSTPIERAKIELLDLRTGKREVLVRGGVFGRYLSTGQLVYASGESMLAVPFDLGRLAVTGPATPVLGDVAVVPSNGLAAFSVSERGDLAYVPASALNAETRPVWVARDGTERPLLTRSGRYAEPALSPDGRRVALTITGSGGNRDVWVYEPTRDILTRITSGEAAEFGPLWTADGRRLIYSSEQPVFDLYSRAADAGTPETPLLVGSSDKYAGSLSPDGKLLAFWLSAPAGSEIWLLPVDGTGKARPLLQSRYSTLHPAFSPDGRWLAYDSDESGRREVYLQSYPDLGRLRRQISTSGGLNPHWTRGGRELVYRTGDSVFAAGVETATGETGRPVFLFAGSYVESGYAVTPDGQRFLMIKVPPESAPRRVEVVLNWFEEMRKAGP